MSRRRFVRACAKLRGHYTARIISMLAHICDRTLKSPNLKTDVIPRSNAAFLLELASFSAVLPSAHYS
jgi:hypothetical protein